VSKITVNDNMLHGKLEQVGTEKILGEFPFKEWPGSGFNSSQERGADINYSLRPISQRRG